MQSHIDADQQELTDQIGNIILSMLSNDIGKMSDDKFVDSVVREVKEITLVQVGHLYDCDAESLVDSSIADAMAIVTEMFIPKRSFRNTFTKGSPDVGIISKAIQDLRARPQPDQRTPAWYRFRHDLITASNAWKAFGTQASINQLIHEKCQPLNVDKYSSVNTETPMHWGQKYEDVSIMYYEIMYNTRVEDFGCMADPQHPFIGASPDGINVDPESSRYGRMLEIKNPTTRTITGIPKSEYWIQMQMQMGVCGLHECDFLETSFKEYETNEEADADGSFSETEDGKMKGVIMYFLHEAKPLYEYAPLNISREEFEIWESKQMEKHANDTWVRNYYWKLEKVSCVLVEFNKVWFDYAVPILKNVWETVETERVTGYGHRAAKRKKKAVSGEAAPPEEGSCCMIDVKKLQEHPVYELEA